METALKLACQHVVEGLGTCPYDVHSLDCADWEDDCERRCKSNIDMAECWEMYFVIMAERKGKMSESATEVLRRLLDERGIEYETNDYMDTYGTNWNGFKATQYSPNANLIMSLTPEQAIAATLGEEKAGRKSPPVGGPGPCGQPSDDIIHDAATLGSGKLTAEQVRETVEKHWHDLPAEYDMPEATALAEYSYDWQAIADELNAMLGSGTCCIVKTPSDSDFSDDWRYRCSECGCNIPVNERDPETGDVINAANYCPNCGRRTVKR